MKVGFHVSIEEGIDRSVDRAVEVGCSTFQIFTRNPRSWMTRSLRAGEAESFREKRASAGIDPVYGHMPYIPNLATPDPVNYQKSKDSLREEVSRCKALGIPFIVTHIGSRVGSPVESAIERIIEALNEASTPGAPMILLENGAGSGGHIGSRLEEIQRIIDHAEPELGVCLDTCHAYAAGYDLRGKSHVEALIKQVEETFGFQRLKLIHLNDSQGELGSGVDHHEHIGLGKIGAAGFRAILRSRLSEVPLIMETPMDDRRGDAENMRALRRLAGLES